jgi:hypothetical protein
VQHYFDNVQDQFGNAVGGVAVLVKIGGVSATIYSDNGINAKTNPLTTASNGAFDFYAANGTYTLTVTHPDGTTSDSFATLFDVNDVNATAIGFSQLAASTGSSLVGFVQSGTGAVARTVQDKQRETVSVTDFAADGVSGVKVDPTGVVDSVLGIQAAFNTASKVLIPSGSYKISASLLIDGNLSVVGDGFNKSLLVPDSSVLEVVKVGSVTAHQGELRGFSIQRAAYSGATENAGFAFYGAFSGSYYDLLSNLSKYNFLFKPGNGQAVAYSQFFNMQGSRGYRNIYWAATGTGYANELKFYGGRMFTSADTETNVHWNGGSNTLFDGVSAEGAGTQAFYIGGAGNKVVNPRTEGTWSADDIVVDASALRTFILAHDFYTTVTDNGTGTSYITHNGGSQLSGSLNTVSPLTLRYSGSTDNTVLPIYSARDNGTSYVWKAMRASDGLVRGYLTTNGTLYGDRAVQAGQSGYNFSPLVLGTWTFWINNNQLYMKNGTPANANDGATVGSSQSVDTAANIASLTATINTTNKFTGKQVWDSTNNRMVRASGATAASAWYVVDGSASVTPV